MLLKKKKEDLYSLNGNYLYLQFNCFGSVTIENTKSGDDTSIIVVVVVIGGFLILLGTIIWCIYRRGKLRRMNPDIHDMPDNYSNQGNSYYPQMPVPGPGYPQYGNQAVVYQIPNSNLNPNVIYVNNPNNVNNYNTPQKMQVYERGATPGEISQNSSNRESYIN